MPEVNVEQLDERATLRAIALEWLWRRAVHDSTSVPAEMTAERFGTFKASMNGYQLAELLADFAVSHNVASERPQEPLCRHCGKQKKDHFYHNDEPRWCGNGTAFSYDHAANPSAQGNPHD